MAMSPDSRRNWLVGVVSEVPGAIQQRAGGVLHSCHNEQRVTAPGRRRPSATRSARRAIADRFGRQDLPAVVRAGGRPPDLATPLSQTLVQLAIFRGCAPVISGVLPRR